MSEETVKKNTKTKAVKAPISFESAVYDTKGKEAGKISLAENIFGLKWNADLVHQVVTSMESTARTNVAHTKNRGDVRGGGKKPWQQKGTGRARHGSIRSPLWRKGGVTHGPQKGEVFDRKVNKKMKAKALYTILSAKFKKGQILFVNDLSMTAPKTKDAVSVVANLSKIKGYTDLHSKRKNSAYINLADKSVNTEKSFRNMNNLVIDEIRNMNPVDLMKYKYVVISNPEKALPQITEKLAK